MKIKSGKKLISLLLLIAGIFAWRLVFAQDFGTNAVNTGLNGALAGGDPREMAGRIINVALGFLGVIALGLIIYAGFLWMTSNGEEDKISQAKKILVSASIGLAIILASWAIATFVISKLSGAINGNNNGICTNGQVSSCECGGSRVCVNDSWGLCVGSDCSTNPHQTSCDADVSNQTCDVGNNMCAPQDYCDNSCVCQPKAGTGESCDADVSNQTCDVDNNRCAQYLSCDATTCTCFGPPVITSISPLGGFCNENDNKACATDADCDTTCDNITPNGAADNFITISGKNFGVYSATNSRVVFMGGVSVNGRNPSEINPVCVNFWQDDQIIIAVPAGVASGSIKVISQDGAEDTTNDDYGPTIPDFVANNISRPGLCLLSPDKGGLSAAVSYQGINLYSGQAYFGNYQTNVQGLDSDFSHPSGLSGTAATPNIRSGESGSFVVNNISGNQERSNYLKFVKEADPNDGPFIVYFSPDQGTAGQYVTISGSGFGGARGTSHVYFASAEANYNFPPVCASSVWSDKQVVVKVPDGLANGSYLIRMTIDGKVIDSQKLNPNVFRVDDVLSLKTSLCKLEPKQGGIATPVKIYGEYFGQVGRDAQVQFNPAKQVYGTISQDNGADIIPVAVPAEAITGPVKVVKNGEWGNELNFEVSACSSDAECPGQVCCPSNTYKKGVCAAILADCLIDIPTSVFEWNFNTGFTINDQDSTESCKTLADYYGACQVNASCPNVPGACSPYAGGTKITVGTCDFSCASVAGCSGFGSGTCSYDATLNKCIKDGSDGLCSLSKTQTFNINNQDVSLSLVCNKDGNWETQTTTSCPDDWLRSSNNVCTDKNSTCDICAIGLDCEQIGSDGRCVSNTICPTGSVCESDPDISKPGVCVSVQGASCDCCCRIEKSAQDCCAPLECKGTCGQDTTPDGVGFGSCSGCANVGTTIAEHDAACNCAGHGGQYCSITAQNPGGICTDCSGLAGLASCSEHNAACCFDANRTPSAGDDFCRGGLGTDISSNPADPGFGYCGYYNCFSESVPPIGDPATCASATPVKVGTYKDSLACVDGCAANPGQDFCSLFNNKKDDCANATSCCFDSQSATCKSGTQISAGADMGYCAYYDCQIDANGVSTCDPTVKTTGQFNNFTTCDTRCGSIEGGVGKDCVASASVATCNFGICNFPGQFCLTESGVAASDISDCGACCCNPADPTACQTAEAPDLYCQPDKGNCSGAGRGLCCGCKNDSDCSGGQVPVSVGCGLDTCCDSRPEVTGSIPATGANNVCRNSVIKVTFNQQMDIASFSANTVLMEEMNYGGAVCPSGTFVYEGDGNFVAVNHGWLSNIFSKLKSYIGQIFGPFNNQALADLPDESKLYCSFRGSVSGEYSGQETILSFAPNKLLTPDAKYFLVVKGDEDLNSQSGVISLSGIGLNGQGLDGVEGESLSFNKKSYKNSYIVQFKTLSDKDNSSGVCAIDKVKITPDSYLFSTTENSIDENDINFQDQTFDTKRDKDKVFKALAYSDDGQVIQPITGYFWDWKFNLSDPSIAAMTRVAVDRVLIATKDGITEGETKLSATIDMVRFLDNNSSVDPGCACTDETCSSRCRNAFSVGDNFTGDASLYVFICANPWPSVNTNGTWYPWSDNCTGAIGACNNFNYKFYYCRDAGNPGTIDDLPAITDKAVIRGQSATLVCSSDNSSCAGLNSTCGADQNGDGRLDGVCIWSVLKESYFFREAAIAGSEILAAADLKTGGAVRLTWQSPADQVGSYKIYYLPANKGTMLSKTVNLSSCSLTGGVYNCADTVTGLTDGTAYVFKISVVSVNKVESSLSSEINVTPTDQTPTGAPGGLNVEDLGDTIKFTWVKNSDNTLFYRVYRGVKSNLYGESFDSTDNASALSWDKAKLSVGDNYFAISALDSYGNESTKSAEVNYNLPLPQTPLGVVLSQDVGSNLVDIRWQQNTDNTKFYRVYPVINGNSYGEPYDTPVSQNWLSIDINNLNIGYNYFVVSAVDRYGNEGGKSTTVSYLKK
ncbi:MAG TPA: IPT/TIG domain-containing protein [Candidatus Saccharimonadales bacterium]|nr:IPT/TIG domain-containing protein [Candidatus Saccharimonadales bacterium]